MYSPPITEKKKAAQEEEEEEEEEEPGPERPTMSSGTAAAAATTASTREMQRQNALVVKAFISEIIDGRSPVDAAHCPRPPNVQVNANLFEGPMHAAWAMCDFAPTSSPRFWIAVYHFIVVLAHSGAGTGATERPGAVVLVGTERQLRRFTTWFFHAFPGLSTARLPPLDVETVAGMLVDLRNAATAAARPDDAARLFIAHLHGTTLGANVLAAVAGTQRGGLELVLHVADTFRHVRLPPNLVYQAFRQLRPDVVRAAVQRGLSAADCSAAFGWWLDQRPPRTPLSAREREMQRVLRDLGL